MIRKMHKMHTLNRLKMVLTAFVRERHAESAENSAISSDSLVHFLSVMSEHDPIWRRVTIGPQDSRWSQNWRQRSIFARIAKQPSVFSRHPSAKTMKMLAILAKGLPPPRLPITVYSLQSSAKYRYELLLLL
jgi:hypothetical protein